MVKPRAFRIQLEYVGADEVVHNFDTSVTDAEIGQVGNVIRPPSFLLNGQSSKDVLQVELCLCATLVRYLR